MTEEAFLAFKKDNHDLYDLGFQMGTKHFEFFENLRVLQLCVDFDKGKNYFNLQSLEKLQELTFDIGEPHIKLYKRANPKWSRDQTRSEYFEF